MWVDGDNSGRGVWIVAFVSGAAVASAEASEPAAFTEEAAARGIVYATTQPVTRGQGVAFADLDADGDPDLVAVGDGKGVVGLFENDGTGVFTDRSAGSGIPALHQTAAIALADYDLDGDLDLYVTRSQATNVLLRNEGGFVFVDVTVDAGVGDDGNAYGCAWGDIDNDGWMDLYVANRTIIPQLPTPNRLYRNLGDGSFEEIAGALGVDRGDDPTLVCAFLDFDRDGDADLYLATDKGTGCESNGYTNHLFENVGGGTFVDITESSGTEACVDGMSIAIGDFDGNGELDLYVTNTPPGNALLMNQGGGVFTREEEAAGVASYAIGWGAVFFDWDHDGREDLYVCNMAEVNRFYHNVEWPCADIAEAMGVDVGGDSFALATADIDADGDLDLVVQTTNERLDLFVNHEGARRRWVKVDVVGRGAARYAVGAQVNVQCHGVWRLREVIAGCNYKSQNDLVLHWGVGEAEMVEAAEIRWPGGEVRTIANLRTNETWTLYPFDKLGDGDQDGDRELDDFFAFQGCYTGDQPGSLDPGCEMMDYEGDGDVDLADFEQFLAGYEGAIEDCNTNGVPDLREILEGVVTDNNGNGVPDECEDVFGDLNGDAVVDFADLLLLLGDWGETGSPADLNGDGIVDFGDLLLLLGAWT